MLAEAIVVPRNEKEVFSLLPAVVPTTIVELSSSQAGALADYLEAQQLTELFADCLVLDAALLKVPTSSLCLLDLSLCVRAAPLLQRWFQEHSCPLRAGCRVVLRKRANLSAVLAEYQGCSWEWNDQGYAVVPAPAQEFSIALDVIDCPHFFQMELPGAGYLNVAVADVLPQLPHLQKKRKKKV